MSTNKSLKVTTSLVLSNLSFIVSPSTTLSTVALTEPLGTSLLELESWYELLDSTLTWLLLDVESLICVWFVIVFWSPLEHPVNNIDIANADDRNIDFNLLNFIRFPPTL